VQLGLLSSLFHSYCTSLIHQAIPYTFVVKSDEQFLNDDNDLLAAEQLLADGFPTVDVSFSKMVADFSLNIAASPNCLEFTGIKTKTTTRTNQQDEVADVSRFPVVLNEDIEKLKSVAVNKNTSRSTNSR